MIHKLQFCCLQLYNTFEIYDDTNICELSGLYDTKKYFYCKLKFTLCPNTLKIKHIFVFNITIINNNEQHDIDSDTLTYEQININSVEQEIYDIISEMFLNSNVEKNNNHYIIHLNLKNNKISHMLVYIHITQEQISNYESTGPIETSENDSDNNSSSEFVSVKHELIDSKQILKLSSWAIIILYVLFIFKTKINKN